MFARAARLCDSRTMDMHSAHFWEHADQLVATNQTEWHVVLIIRRTDESGQEEH
jgi:hypothetical protein